MCNKTKNDALRWWATISKDGKASFPPVEDISDIIKYYQSPADYMYINYIDD